jgi:hypothetical protein
MNFCTGNSGLNFKIFKAESIKDILGCTYSNVFDNLY